MEFIDGLTIEACVEQYSRLIFSICYKMTGDYFDAEDLTQDTFLSAHRALKSFSGGSIKAWLVTIAANKCRDYLKSASRRVLPAEDTGLNERAADNPAREVEEKDELARLESLCAQLKEPYRGVAIDHFVLGLSVPDIARKTQANSKTVHTRVARARQQLKIIWKEGGT